jgi:hypothetical protein
MGTATGCSPKRRGTSALAGSREIHVPADTETAQDAPRGRQLLVITPVAAALGLLMIILKDVVLVHLL